MSRFRWAPIDKLLKQGEFIIAIRAYRDAREKSGVLAGLRESCDAVRARREKIRTKQSKES